MFSVSGHQSYVCTPQNYTEINSCTKDHWIKIGSELYASRREDGTPGACDLNLTCNNFVQDIGLAANCNGPVKDELIPCHEEVDFEGARSSGVQCLTEASNLASIVDYSCIPSK